jgi:hypothetical protein
MAVEVSVRWKQECVGLWRTMCAVGAHHAAHAHSRCAVEEALGDQAVCLGDTRKAARDREDAVVDALDNLADAGAHARLVAQVSDVLARLADNDAGLLGRDNGAQGELRVGVLLLGTRGHVGLAIHVEAVKLLGDAVGVLASASLGLFGGHGRNGLGVLRVGVSDVVLRRVQPPHLRESRRRRECRGGLVRGACRSLEGVASNVSSCVV